MRSWSIVAISASVGFSMGAITMTASSQSEAAQVPSIAQPAVCLPAVSAAGTEDAINSHLAAGRTRIVATADGTLICAW